MEIFSMFQDKTYEVEDVQQLVTSLDDKPVTSLVTDADDGQPVTSPFATWCQCYKTFYGRNLRMFVIS